jgi:hypothetical protein
MDCSLNFSNDILGWNRSRRKTILHLDVDAYRLVLQQEPLHQFLMFSRQIHGIRLVSMVSGNATVTGSV